VFYGTKYAATRASDPRTAEDPACRGDRRDFLFGSAYYHAGYHFQNDKEGMTLLERVGIDRMIRWLGLLSVIIICGCEELVVKNPASLLVPTLQRSEILGLVAGFGTTFAAVPDLFKMFRRRSSKGINPTMAGIMGVFQIVWVYYGLLIASRPVILWNFIAVIINFMTVWAYFRFARREMNNATE
jgi:MtN3 and saliva related transmembrane protein